MDIVIPLGNGSRYNNAELRFCLRAIEKFVDVDEIYIIGDTPHFLQNAMSIDFKESKDNKYKDQNIFRKVYWACKHLPLKEFMYMNDDHFLLQKFIEEYHYKETLKQTLESKPLGDPYRKVIRNTLEIYPAAKNFDTHCPITFDAKTFRTSMDYALWEKPYGYCMKTLYCEKNHITGMQYEDVKIDRVLSCDDISELLKGKKYFSVGDHAFDNDSGMFEFLKTQFPNTSKYEMNELDL